MVGGSPAPAHASEHDPAKADNAEILRAFEHGLDGSWRCVSSVTITTPSGVVRAEPGQSFVFGQRVAGLDVAEYLEMLGASFGS
jgi:hypothetical protein